MRDTESPTADAMNARQRREGEIVKEVKAILKARLSSNYVVHVGKAILYKIEIDAFGEIAPKNVKSATLQKNYAFQTDVLIERKAPAVPLVVLELKYGRFSSHDVITYSAKAARHKSIYPYLRYGFVVVGLDRLGRRFVTHNESFDFAAALPQLESHTGELIALVKRQITNAESLRSLLETNQTKIKRYEHSIAIE